MDGETNEPTGLGAAAGDTGTTGTTQGTAGTAAPAAMAGYGDMGDSTASDGKSDVAASTVAGNFLIPDAYKDKEWAQNFAKTADPVSEVFKGYDSLLAKFGERPPTVPGDDATPEQRAAWRKYIGLPDSAADYKYEPPKLEGDDTKLVEYLSKERPPEFISAMATKAHELGITPKQFEAMAQAYDTAYINANKSTILEMQQADAALNQDFESKAAAMLGERKEVVLKNGQALLNKVIPADSQMRVHLNQFNNEQLLAVAMVAGALHDKYEREDNFGSKDIGAGTVNKAQLEAEITSLMAQDAFRNYMHADHAKVNAQINGLYERMGLIGAVYKK